MGEVGEEEQRQEMRGLQEQRRPAAAIPLSPLNDCDQASRPGPLSLSLYLSLSVVLHQLVISYTLQSAQCVCVCVCA